MSYWGVLPVKELSLAKTRLSPCLDPQQRQRLMGCLVDRALSALAEASELEGILVIGERVVHAGNPRIAYLSDPGHGHNAAVACGVSLLTEWGIAGAAVIAGDLPLLGVEDISALVRAGLESEVAIAPDRHGTGTNALFLKLPTRMSPSFGVGSFERHVQAAQVCEREPSVIRRLGFELDIDNADDLDLLFRLEPGMITLLQSGSESL
jgi:2-phospho-L-lactate guanylyltransferase